MTQFITDEVNFLRYCVLLGANDQTYRPQVTSYDFDSPITEAGDLRSVKFRAIQEVIYKVSLESHLKSTFSIGH